MSWGAASPIRPNRHSPAARCTEDIHNMDGAEGRGVTGIAFTAFFQCSPQSPCIPSNEFFANKSKHHKQTHEPTLILSHLSPLLASSFPGERIFTKHSKFPFQLIFIILLPDSILSPPRAITLTSSHFTPLVSFGLRLWAFWMKNFDLLFLACLCKTQSASMSNSSPSSHFLSASLPPQMPLCLWGTRDLFSGVLPGAASTLV